jgi:cytosine/adenosine deaminase-related metal-dependent hydrolase
MLYRGWAESEEEFTAVAQLAGRMGLRAYLGPCYMSGLSYRRADGTIAQHYDEAKGMAGLNGALRFASRHDGSFAGRIRAFLAPDRIETQSETVLRTTAEAVRGRGLPMRLHCCQSPYEFDLVRQRTGKTPYGWLQSLGLLTPHALLPHGIYTSGAEDLTRLADSGASVVHCPVVFARSGEALHSFSSMASRGITMAMGTDTFPPDMIDNLRQGLNICHIMDGGTRQATAAGFYNAATLGGARALDRGDLGRLAPGAKADITVFDLSGFHIGQVTDPIHSMVLAGTGRDFRAAYIDGKPVMEDFRVIGADHEALAARAQRQFAKAIESHARQAGRPGEAGRLLSPSFPVIMPPR